MSKLTSFLTPCLCNIAYHNRWIAGQATRLSLLQLRKCDFNIRLTQSPMYNLYSGLQCFLCSCLVCSHSPCSQQLWVTNPNRATEHNTLRRAWWWVCYTANRGFFFLEDFTERSLDEPVCYINTLVQRWLHFVTREFLFFLNMNYLLSVGEFTQLKLVTEKMFLYWFGQFCYLWKDVPRPKVTKIHQNKNWNFVFSLYCWRWPCILYNTAWYWSFYLTLSKKVQIQ